MRHLEIKVVLFAIPILYTFVINPAGELYRTLLNNFVYILAATTVYFLIAALVNYSSSHDSSVFFYHALVSPFKQHAIQFSILVFIAIIFILHNLRQGMYVKNRLLHVGLVIYFVLFILLLSSKLIISYTVVFFFCYVVMHFRKNGINRIAAFAASFAFIAVTALTLFTKNPVSKRFNEIITGDIGLVADDKYNPGMYFNGLQFRLLQWRIVSEILNEKKAWITGVSPGNTQKSLDEKYIARNMFIGSEGVDSHGFLGYNCHNQLLESALQTGILGLITFLFICYGLLRMAWKAKNSLFTAFVLLLLANMLIESVFETQYGLIIYTFFPLLLYHRMKFSATRSGA